MSRLLVYGHAISQPTRAVLWALQMKGVPFELVDVQRRDINDTYLHKFPAGVFPCIEEFTATRPSEAAVGMLGEATGIDQEQGQARRPTNANTGQNGTAGSPGPTGNSSRSQAPFRLQESNAILTYLADRHGWSDLYPTDRRQRAVVDQWLHWHHGSMRPATAHFFRPMMQTFTNTQHTAQGKVAPFKDWDMSAEFSTGRSILRDSFLTMRYGAFVNGRDGTRIRGGQFLCGEVPTLADIAAYCELDGLEATGVLDALGPSIVPPEITEWMGRMKELPQHDEVRLPLRRFLRSMSEDRATMASVDTALKTLRA